MTGAKSVTATFQPATYPLTTVVSGNGTVTGTGIACATGSTGDCTDTLANGASVTLTATPDGQLHLQVLDGLHDRVRARAARMSMTAAKT